MADAAHDVSEATKQKMKDMKDSFVETPETVQVGTLNKVRAMDERAKERAESMLGTSEEGEAQDEIQSDPESISDKTGKPAEEAEKRMRSESDKEH